MHRIPWGREQTIVVARKAKAMSIVRFLERLRVSLFWLSPSPRVCRLRGEVAEEVAEAGEAEVLEAEVDFVEVAEVGVGPGGWSGGGFRAGSFNGGGLARSGYAGRLGGYEYDRGYGSYFGRGGYGGWGWGGYGLGWGLGYGLGWGLGDWGYPYDYGYGYYSPDSDYYYSYAPTDYGITTVGTEDTNIAVPQQSGAANGRHDQGPTATGQRGTSVLFGAREAFLQGNYQNALRLGGHAAVEAPQNPKVHELISLALFALGNYTAAANEAHAAMALGPIADWNDLYAYYNDANKYTTQLRALERAAAQNPKSAADHFLLGYHYLMTGARDNAKRKLPGGEADARAISLPGTTSNNSSPTRRLRLPRWPRDQ